MAHSNVVAAFRDRLQSEWTHAAECSILTDLNVGDLPARPFLQIMFPVANAWQMTVGAPGANIWREEGGCLIVLNVERNAGADEWLPWMDEIAAIFRGKVFDGVRTDAPTSAAYEDDNEEGNSFELRVAVPYEYDIIG